MTSSSDKFINSGSEKLLNPSDWKGNVFTGTWEKAKGGNLAVMEPATGEVLTETGLANAQDVVKATAVAVAAQPVWAAMAPRERAAIFRRAAAILQQHFDELALWVVRETGGIIPKGQLEIRESIELFNIAASMPLEAQGTVLPSTAGRLSYAKRTPLGVVCVISPFNVPMVLSMRAVAPALAAGNAVIIKPDPQTPVSGGFIIARALQEAGLPAGVLQVLPGGAEAGEALCNAPAVRMIAFTGSTAVGRRIAETAGKHLKKVSLELGGKSPLIILEDADLDVAASNAAWGAFLHQGQICMASGRIFVQEKIAAEFIRRLAEKASHLPVGNPATEQVAIGPLINERQRDKVHSIVLDSVKAGAKLEAGGSYEKLFYKPTVLSGVKPGMRAFNEEVFGPVANVITFSSDEEVIALANDTEYGLSSGIISADTNRAMRIGERLHSGMLHINDQTVNDECVNPFGGCGCSGNGGNIGGPTNWENFSQLRWITVQAAAHPYPF
jgi:benzaldehyde dehydrogenase (NAD)